MQMQNHNLESRLQISKLNTNSLQQLFDNFCNLDPLQILMRNGLYFVWRCLLLSSSRFIQNKGLVRGDFNQSQSPFSFRVQFSDRSSKFVLSVELFSKIHSPFVLFVQHFSLPLSSTMIFTFFLNRSKIFQPNHLAVPFKV